MCLLQLFKQNISLLSFIFSQNLLFHQCLIRTDVFFQQSYTVGVVKSTFFPTETQEYLSLCLKMFCVFSAGPVKTSLLSAPSTASMFVPAPEDFSDEQPTTMADRWGLSVSVLV